MSDDNVELRDLWGYSVLGQMERLSIKCFFLTSCFSSYCESMHVCIIEIKFKKSDEKVKKTDV